MAPPLPLSPDLPTCSADAARAALAHVVGSATFRSSVRHRDLLAYLVETALAEGGQGLREMRIALEALGRSSADFDPAGDAIVRVEMTRLRAKLKAFYQTEGRDDPVAIDIPKGAYLPHLVARTGPAATPQAGPSAAAGVERAPTPDPSDVPPAPPRTGRASALTAVRSPWAAVTLAAVAVVIAVASFLHAPRTAISERALVAVMPYTTTGQDEQVAQLGELVAAFTNAALSRLPDVRLLAPASVTVALQQHPDRGEAVRALAADYLITGRISRNPQGVEIETHLVRTRDERDVLARSIIVAPERAIEGQAKVAVELLAKLSPDSRTAITSAFAMPADPVARERWAFARLLMNRFTPQAMSDAEPLLRDVLAREPGFAPAYTSRAIALWWSTSHRAVTPRALAPEIRQAAEQALALDSNDAAAYTALAAIATTVDYDLARGEALYRQALRLAPSSADVHQAFAGGLLYMGRYDEALAEVRLARALSPFSLSARFFEALVLTFAGKEQEGFAAFDEVLKVDPQNPLVVRWYVYLRTLAGHPAQATAILDQLSPQQASTAIGRMTRIFVDARSGHVDTARRDYDALLRDAGRTDTWAYEEATLLHILGEHARGLERLDASFDVGLPIAVGIDPVWDDMRRDARFRAILERRAPQILAVSDRRLSRPTQTALLTTDAGPTGIRFAATR